MKTYLCIVGVLSVIALIQCNDNDSLIDKIQECAEEFSLTKDAFLEIVNSILTAFDNSKFRCVLACLLKKDDRLMDGKVSIDKELDTIKETWPNETEESLKEKVTECANKGNQETDDCEVAGVHLKCLYEKIVLKE